MSWKVNLFYLRFFDSKLDIRKYRITQNQLLQQAYIFDRLVLKISLHPQFFLWNLLS
jgi:hypothetical protein